MENASEALKIAGGILLALMTISVFIFMFSNISTMGEARENQRQAKYVANWNAEWEAYNKKIMYGTEVLSVINKARSVDEGELVNITVTIVEEEYKEGKLISTETTVIDIERRTTKVTINNVEQKSEEKIKEGINKLNERKTNIFNCVNVTYGGENGRINSMKFEGKIKINK